jgi:hypothetical protein
MTGMTTAFFFSAGNRGIVRTYTRENSKSAGSPPADFSFGSLGPDRSNILTINPFPHAFEDRVFGPSIFHIGRTCGGRISSPIRTRKGEGHAVHANGFFFEPLPTPGRRIVTEGLRDPESSEWCELIHTAVPYGLPNSHCTLSGS